MSNLRILAPEVVQCAIAAEFDVSAPDRNGDGRAVFTANLGETTFLVGLETDDIVVVSESDRLQPDYLVFAAPSASTVERYLLMTFGSTFRFRRRFPRIRIPVARDQVASGFDVANRSFRGDERLALIGTDGQPVAWSRSDPYIATVALVELSHHMMGSVNDIAASYLNPSASPLFDHFVHNGTTGELKDVQDAKGMRHQGLQ